MNFESKATRKANLLWKRLNFFLFAALLAEGCSLLLLKTGAGESILKGGAFLLRSTLGLLKALYEPVGLMIVPFLILTVVLLGAIKSLIWCYRTKPEGYNAKKLLTVLNIVEDVAPGFGFLGTCLGLMQVMSSIDPNIEQKVMLPTLCKGASTAFITTILGLILCIAAYFSRQVFLHFLPVGSEEKPREMRIVRLLPRGNTSVSKGNGSRDKSVRNECSRRPSQTNLKGGQTCADF